MTVNATSCPPQMPQTVLGTTGIRAGTLGLGGFHQVEMSSEVVAATVETFLAHGGTYIETARGYGGGASEEKLGAALAGRRDRVVLVSKSGERTGDGIQRDLAASLRALNTDRLDFYYLHGVTTEADIDRICAARGALAALERARAEGTIAGIGFSSHRPPMYLRALERLPLSVVLIWYSYLEHLYLPEIEGGIIPALRAAGVAVTIMKPLSDGYLYRSARAALRYALAGDGDLVVCGMNSPDQVREGVAAVCQGPATAAEKAEIMRTAPELGKYVCRQCGACSGALMELFRLEGYVDRQMLDYLPHDPADYALRTRLASWFDLGDIGRERFAAAGFASDALLDEAAQVTCAYGIDVPRKTRLALAKLSGADPARV